MSNYTPADSHFVNLNFKDELQVVDAHNVVLNFGIDEIQTAAIDAVINTLFFAELIAESFSLNTLDANIQTGFIVEIYAVQGQLSQLDSTFSTGFTAEIIAVRIDQFCTLEANVSTLFKPDLTARFDINHNVGVFYLLTDQYQLAQQITMQNAFKFSKPILKALNSAFFYDKGLVLSVASNLKFEKANALNQSIQKVYEHASGLGIGSNFVWQDNERIRIERSLIFEESKKLNIQRQFDWVELVKKRKQFTYSYDVAQHFERIYQFEWDRGLELITTSHLAWDVAKPIHYRKHPIQPWPKPEIPEYVGNTDLEFNCLCAEVDAHNVILNFGVDNCIPGVANKKWWYIVNNVSVVNTRTGEEIKVYNGSYNTDRSRWCWSYSLTVAEPEISKLEIGDVLQISVNGNTHLMLYEEHSKSRQFADTKYTLTGRSQSALLESKYSAVRSYLQENERTSVQLVQAELDRVNSGTLLDWQLLDELGWIVETESLSYTNLAPIDVIKMIAEAGGGFIYSEKNSNTISIRPLYKKTYWDTMQFDDYDKILPESLVLQHSESFDDLSSYNSITLTNSRNGNVGQVKRRDTAGDILLEPVSNTLFTAVSMGGFGKAQLAKSGRVESHDFTLPIESKLGEFTPGETVAFNAEWWGVVDSVSVSFTYAEVKQQIKVERTVNE